MSKQITRSTVNEQQYAAPAFPKSGFNLTHRRYSSYILGRIQCSGYQDVMPGDKIAGKNDGTFTFNNIVTPMLPKVDVQQYNFLMMFRALDRTFERAFAPSKNNNMSAEWSVPGISTKDIVEALFSAWFDAVGPQTTLLQYRLETIFNGNYNDTILERFGDDESDALSALYGNSTSGSRVYANGIITSLSEVLFNPNWNGSNAIRDHFKSLYLDDVLEDIRDNFHNKLGIISNTIDTHISLSTTIGDFLYTLFDCFLTPFVGRYSYYYDLKYNYVRPKDLYTLCHDIQPASIASFIDSFSSIQQSEYPLRAMYTVWYEYFRNVDLEPVSQYLPYWRDFGSTSVVLDNLAMLVYRPRPWYEDMFISAQIDDLSRHVWAPIVSTDSDIAAVHTNSINSLDTQYNDPFDNIGSGGQVKPHEYKIGWMDQITGTPKTISCPVPSNINDILSSLDSSFIDVYGLDLNSLRQAQQLERYLKRNYLFGDEYNDRMLAHYNSRVSDLRINRPELISQSFNSSDNKQEIANMSNGISNAGDRTATATISASGDNYSAFSEEFGILLHVITFMPTACYDGIHPQLLLSKVQDFPLPEFATNNEEFGRKLEIAASGLELDNEVINMFGRYPAYHSWRSRVDEVGGMFLDELQDCTFRRFWGFGDDSIPKLNYHFIHCRPSLQMFRNTNVYDSQIYGDVVHECYVERVLPTPVEQI